MKGIRPVRVARSAIGPNKPYADLYITQNHAFLIDGILVRAGTLINGMTIAIYDAHEDNELEFFHIKPAHHKVIYAEGMPYEL